MQRLTIRIPDDLSAHRNKAQLEQLAREALAVRLYSLGELSSGEAAELLNIPRREFPYLVSRYGVSIFDESIDLGCEASYGD